MKPIKSTAVCLALLCAASIATGKTDHQKVKATTTPKISMFAQEPFDPGVDALPKNFRGHSCSAVAGKIKVLNPAKGPYETSSDYADRVTAIQGTALYGNTKVGSKFAFAPQDSMPLRGKYDADAATMSLSLFLVESSRMMVGPNFVGTAIIERKILDRKSYVGSNSFGRKVQVASTHYTACALAFENLDTIHSPESVMRKISFELSPSDAKAVEANMALLFVGSIAPPFYQEFSGYSKPTIDSPYESYGGGDTLVMKLSEIWVFDRISGRVLAKSSI
jgi:hypothetical protein